MRTGGKIFDRLKWGQGRNGLDRERQYSFTYALQLIVLRNVCGEFQKLPVFAKLTSQRDAILL